MSGLVSSNVYTGILGRHAGILACQHMNLTSPFLMDDDESSYAGSTTGCRRVVPSS